MTGAIRAYEPSDLEEVIEVWKAASRLAHPFLDTAFLEREQREIEQTHIPQAETWVYEEGGHVVGFIALLENEVGGLFVSPAHHRRGLGRALMNHARSTRSWLELSVFEENGLGREFYESYGFKPVGRQRHEGSGHIELRMRLESE